MKRCIAGFVVPDDDDDVDDNHDNISRSKSSNLLSFPLESSIRSRFLERSDGHPRWSCEKRGLGAEEKPLLTYLSDITGNKFWGDLVRNSFPFHVIDNRSIDRLPGTRVSHEGHTFHGPVGFDPHVDQHGSPRLSGHLIASSSRSRCLNGTVPSLDLACTHPATVIYVQFVSHP